jgi:hypothetical protein
MFQSHRKPPTLELEYQPPSSLHWRSNCTKTEKTMLCFAQVWTRSSIIWASTTALVVRPQFLSRSCFLHSCICGAPLEVWKTTTKTLRMSPFSMLCALIWNHKTFGRPRWAFSSQHPAILPPIVVLTCAEAAATTTTT